MSKRGGVWYCDYHPDIKAHFVKRDGVKYITCEECEYNPPDFGSGISDVGRTLPEVKTRGFDE